MTHELETSARQPVRGGSAVPMWATAAPASWWEYLSGAVCLFVGVTLILNIHPIGDGMWFWYAVDLRHGVRLYRDLHLALQPLYVLLTAASQAVLGTGWLAGKLFPLLQVVAFTWLLVRLSRFVPWQAWQRACLVVAAFLFTVQPSTYRFDDYHVTSDIFTLACLLLLLQMGVRARTERAVIAFAGAMGVCCGLAGMTRLNDGAALAGAAGCALLLLYPRRIVAALAGLCVGGLLAVGLTLLLVREQPAAWWHWSIAMAGAIKGGNGNILLSPLLLPYHLFLNILTWKTPLAVVYVVCLWFAVQSVSRRYRSDAAKGWQLPPLLWAGALLAGAFPFVHHAQVQTPLELLVRLATLVFLVVWVALAAYALQRWLRGKAALPRPAYALLLFPGMHLIGGALTAAHTLPDPYLSLAMLLLIVPLLPAAATARQWALPALANLLLLAAIIAGGKVQHPYYWWTYDDGPIYRNRVWYHHPELGPMYIERPQLALATQMCRTIAQGDGERPSGTQSLLSMPFPYMNYFCGLPPWHDSVQTWYDTASAETIQRLTEQLDTAPPHWIAYEYDPNAILAHELTYHHGRPIAHRALKDLVLRKIDSGAWTVRQHGCSHLSEWLLIETRRDANGAGAEQVAFDPRGGLCR